MWIFRECLWLEIIASLFCLGKMFYRTICSGKRPIWLYYYRPQTKLREGNVFYTYLSFCSRGGRGLHNPPGFRPPPPDVALLDADPSGCRHPPNADPLDADSPRCRPPPPRYMGYYGIRPTNGRHASCWNAYLYLNEAASILVRNSFQSICQCHDNHGFCTGSIIRLCEQTLIDRRLQQHHITLSRIQMQKGNFL